MARARGARALDLSRVRGFALDEYIGLPPGHPQSYRAVITREVVEPLGLTPSLVHVPGDDGGPIEGAGERYEAAIAAAGGVDIQVLGIGANRAHRLQRARLVVRLARPASRR